MALEFRVDGSINKNNTVLALTELTKSEFQLLSFPLSLENNSPSWLFLVLNNQTEEKEVNSYPKFKSAQIKGPVWLIKTLPESDSIDHEFSISEKLMDMIRIVTTANKSLMIV